MIGSTLTTHTNSQIRINVTATKKDVVAFDGTSAFTFNPSYTTPFYSFKTTGNASAGWIVTATKQVDTTLFPAVQNLEPTLIAETNATVHSDVISVAPDGEATLRAYFGTVDKGANFGAWEQVVQYPATVTATGVYSLKLTTLALNQTYYVRHSISNSTGESMSPDVVSLTTRPWETPDSFTWVATNADWHTEGVWTINTPYERRMPEFKGDKITINVGGSWPNTGINRTLNLANDVSIGTMTVNQGFQSQVAVTATNGPATLTFDADASGTNYIAATSQLAGLRFGNTGSNYGLTIELKQPLVFQKGTAYGLDAAFYADHR